MSPIDLDLIFKFKPGDSVRHKWKPRGEWKVIQRIVRVGEIGPYSYTYLVSKKSGYDSFGWPCRTGFVEMKQEELEKP